MRISSLRAALCAAVVLVATSAFGATYYVATTGSDSNDGSSGAPWATLQKAVNSVVPGDTVIVRDGTYAGFRRTETGTGTAGAPITIMAEHAGKVLLNAVSSANKHNGVLELEGGWDTSTIPMAYWVIDGFEVDGTNAHRAIDTRITTHLTIQNCIAHNSKASATAVATGIFASFCDAFLEQYNTSYRNTEHGTYPNNSADNGVLRGNVLYSNVSLGVHMNGDLSQGGAAGTTGDGVMSGWLIEKNLSFSNGTSGFDGDGVTGSIWKNNVTYGNRGIQMTAVDGSWNPDSDRFINNTLTTQIGGFYVLNFAINSTTKPGGTQNVIENNILYHNDVTNAIRGSLDYITAWLPVTSDYNVVAGVKPFALDDSATQYTLPQWQSLTGQDMHSVQCNDATVLFANRAANDYHLKAGSPAIDAGMAIADVTEDKDGVARPQGSAYDCGAYELVQSSTLAVTTTTLPAVTINSAFSQALQATGGTSPYAWSVPGDGLPAGLSLDPASGILAGTPTATGIVVFTVMVTDNVGATATQALSMVVNPAPTITTASLPAWTRSFAGYNQLLSASGGTPALRWSLASGSLPTGLTLNAFAGAVSGTPSAVGTYNFTIAVTDSFAATATKAFSVVINAAISVTTTSLPADTVGVAYTRTLAATGGTGALAWSISSGSLGAGLSLAASTGVISGTPTVSGTRSFTARATDTVGATGSRALSIVVNPAPGIGTTSLPGDTIGVAYNQTLSASGGTAPRTWSISSGSLPAGLSLNASTGAITGTPAATGTSSFTAAFTDSLGAVATQALSIVINPVPAVTTASLPPDTVGIFYSQTLASTGGTAPLVWSLPGDGLPGGLSLNAATGAITGSPTAAMTASITATVTDNVGVSASQALSIVINPVPVVATLSLPADTVNIAYSQTLASTGGTAPLVWSLSSGNLPDGLSLDPATGAVTGTPTTPGTSSFTAQVVDSVGASAAQALFIAVNIPLSVTTASLPADTVGIAYSQTLSTAGGTTPVVWSITSGSLPDGVSLDSTTGAVTGTPTTAGTSAFTAQATDNVGATAAQALSIVINPVPSITTTSLPADTLTASYSETLAATGGTGALTWTISDGSLPDGLSLDSAAGAVTGTPTTAGTSDFTVQATDTLGASVTQALSIIVNAVPSITTTALPADTAGIAYSQAIAAAGGTAPLTWSITDGGLPAGLTLDPATGAIAGVPTMAGAQAFMAVVTDNVGITAVQPLSITINPAPVVTTTSLPADTVGVAYDQTLAATGGTAPLVWTITSGNLPDGLSLDAFTGTITGTPSAAQTAAFTATVTDIVGAAASQALSIAVNNAVNILTASLPAGTLTAGYSQTLTAVGGTGFLTWMIAEGSLPGGLSLDAASGAITGTPDVAGTFNFTAKATDSLAASGTKALSIVANAVPTITTTSLPAETVGIAYNQTLGVSGGTAPFTWSIPTGNLPAGLGIDASAGAVTGTPTTGGTSAFTAKVVDANSVSAAKGLSIVINDALTVATTSLPGATIGAAYSQMLAAAGGVPTYSWSIISGSLPSGLTLVASTGMISGTATTPGTSNFTVRVTDSHSPASTSDRALSIVASDPTYAFAASDAESATTSTAWHTKASLAFNSTQNDAYVFLAFAEYKGANSKYASNVQFVVDGAPEGAASNKPVNAADYIPFSAQYFTNLAPGPHTLVLQYASANAGTTTYIRNARIIAIRAAGAPVFSQTADAATALTVIAKDYVTLTWTPPAAGQYLVLYNCELNADTDFSTPVIATYTNGIAGTAWTSSQDKADYTSLMCFAVVNANASQQKAAIAAFKPLLSKQADAIRRCRVTVVGLSGTRLDGGASAFVALRATSSTTFVQALSKTWTSGANGNWLLLTTALYGNTSTKYQTEVRAQVNAVTDGQEIRMPKNATDSFGFCTMDVKNFTSPRQVNVDFRTTNSGGTAGIAGINFVALPLGN